MRAVDLTCLIAAPLAAGCLMTYGGMRVAIAAIALWNVAAWAPECLLLGRAQSSSSALRWAGNKAADWISLLAVWTLGCGCLGTARGQAVKLQTGSACTLCGQ